MPAKKPAFTFLLCFVCVAASYTSALNPLSLWKAKIVSTTEHNYGSKKKL
jgi:hypothetical protein